MEMFLSLKRYGKALDAKPLPYAVCLPLSGLAAFWCWWIGFAIFFGPSQNPFLDFLLAGVLIVVLFGLLIGLQALPLGVRQVAVLRQRLYVEDDRIIPTAEYRGDRNELVLAREKIRGALVLLVVFLANGGLFVLAQQGIQAYLFRVVMRPADYPECYLTFRGKVECTDPTLLGELYGQFHTNFPALIFATFAIVLAVSAWFLVTSTGAVRFYDSYVVWIRRPGTGPSASHTDVAGA